MNKQALAFISMFTLVLMLSIYYVSLDTIPANSQPIDNTNSTEMVISMLKQQNDEEKETMILLLKEQLGKSINEDKKVEIMAKIDAIENNQTNEEKILDLLMKSNIKSVVCIEDDIVNIQVFELEKSDKKAEEIMRLVYKNIKLNQTIELTFS